MKLADIKGERCFDVMADLVNPIANLAEDNEVIELFKVKKTPKGKSPREFFIERMKSGLPTLLKTHKRDFVDIMAILNDQTPEEYTESLTFPKLFSDVLEIITDDELLAFLPS